jgi:hypothetical protein
MQDSTTLLQRIDLKLSQAKACKFLTGKQLKRMNGDWDVRYDWKLYDANNKIMSESEWEGFATLPEALEDMLTHIE